MDGMKRIYSIRFRKSHGPVDLVQPKGSKLLRVHQSGSGYWFADMLAPALSHEEEPLRLWLVSNKDKLLDMDDSWHCVGDSVSKQGLHLYVFHKQATPAKRKPGRPRKAAKAPPIDADKG